jgi:hypothetical protein
MIGKIRVAGLSAGLFALVWAQGGAVVSAQMSHEGHGGMSHESKGHGSAAAPSAPAMPEGVVIRESKVQGAAFVYRLYSWEERNAMMKGMEGHTMPGMDNTGKSTNHLMVFIKGADGKYLSGGKVGFIVTGPDKSEFKTLTMGMSDGYGADVALRAKGSYSIRTKAVFGDQTLNDEFTHAVK